MKRAVVIGIALIFATALFIIGVVLLLFMYSRNSASGRGVTTADSPSAAQIVEKLQSKTEAPPKLRRPFINEEDDFFAENSDFPLGSFAVSVGTLMQGPEAMEPLDVNKAALGEAGFHFDNSTLVAEEGRLVHLYVQIPPTTNLTTIAAPIRRARSRRTTRLRTTQSVGRGRSRPERSVDHGGGRRTVISPVSVNAIGIRFGESSKLQVIPIKLAPEPASGIGLVATADDGSKIYQIRVRLPNTACSSLSTINNNIGSCHALKWRSYSIIGDGRIVAVPHRSHGTLYLTCGSQCERDPLSRATTPCAHASCRKCDGLQTSGSNNPVTRRYNLGVTMGTFEFHYDTYKVRDRVTIWFDRKVIFDSGCVGERGRLASIPFNGTSKELRIDVEPNCLGLVAGTGWHFALTCNLPPTNADTNNDEEEEAYDEAEQYSVDNSYLIGQAPFIAV